MLVSIFIEHILENFYSYWYSKTNLNFLSTLIDLKVKILIYIIIDWLSQSNQIIVLCWSGKITIFDAQDCSGYIKQWAYSFSQANVEQYLSKTMLFNGIIE